MIMCEGTALHNHPLGSDRPSSCLEYYMMFTWHTLRAGDEESAMATMQYFMCLSVIAVTSLTNTCIFTMKIHGMLQIRNYTTSFFNRSMKYSMPKGQQAQTCSPTLKIG